MNAERFGVIPIWQPSMLGSTTRLVSVAFDGPRMAKKKKKKKTRAKTQRAQTVGELRPGEIAEVLIDGERVLINMSWCWGDVSFARSCDRQTKRQGELFSVPSSTLILRVEHEMFESNNTSPYIDESDPLQNRA